MQEKSGLVALKDDEKARIHAEYVTLLVHVKALRKSANINEFALRFLTHTFHECTVEAHVSAFDSIYIYI